MAQQSSLVCEALGFLETEEAVAKALHELGDPDRVQEDEEFQHADAAEHARQQTDLDQLLTLWHFVLAFRAADDLEPIFSALEEIAARLEEGQELTLTDIDAVIALTHTFEGTRSPEPQRDLAWHMDILARILLGRFFAQKNIQYLDAAVATSRRACELAPGNLDYVERLILALFWRFPQLKQTSDLDEAYRLVDSALTTANVSAERPYLFSCRAALLALRANQSDDADGMDDAISSTRIVGRDDPSSVVFLELALTDRFYRYHELSDLDIAISIAESRAALEDCEPSPASPLIRVASLYLTRFIATGRLNALDARRRDIEARRHDIDRAIALRVRVCKRSSSGNDGHLNDRFVLVLSYTERFESFRDVVDLDNAIEVLHDIKSMHDLNNVPYWYYLYGKCMLVRCTHFDDSVARHEMIRVLEEGASRFPEGSEDRGIILRMLADARLHALHYDLRMIHNRSESHGLPTFEDFLITCMSSLLQTLLVLVDATIASGDHPTQFCLTRAFAITYSVCHQFILTPEHAELFLDIGTVKNMHTLFLTLMPEVIWLGHTLSRRYEEASKLQPAVSAGVATASLLEDKNAALEWFEQGRAIVWSQIQILRTPLDGLRHAHPDLADKLEQLSLKLEGAGLRDPLPSLASSDILALGYAAPIEEQSVAGRSLAREHQKQLHHIRSLNGFEDFLRPKTAQTLLGAAMGSRAVACINVSLQTRCDALIVFGSDVHLVHLPELTSVKVDEWHVKLTRRLQRKPARTIDDTRHNEAVRALQNSDAVRGVLQEMWECVVQPIVKVYLDILKEGRPHITWCTTGRLAFLPLHAAGPHDGESPNAFDLVVSSYAPNLSSLLPPATVFETDVLPSILVVAQPDTPTYLPRGVSSLPETETELENIKKRFEGTNSEFLLRGQGTIPEVLQRMAKHPYIHLACHGKQDADPTNSSFSLHDGPLTLNKLMEQRLSNAQLAFLSACETATGDETVPNEAVHLAAGMLAAGYKSVVATMWTIGDEDAPLVADEFYKALLADPQHNVAFALHHAVKTLRESQDVGIDAFVRWMPYIHLGV